jgi:hypothetical protein
MLGKLTLDAREFVTNRLKNSGEICRVCGR